MMSSTSHASESVGALHPLKLHVPGNRAIVDDRADVDALLVRSLVLVLLEVIGEVL